MYNFFTNEERLLIEAFAVCPNTNNKSLIVKGGEDESEIVRMALKVKPPIQSGYFPIN